MLTQKRDEPLSKDRITPKIASIIDRAFDARDWLLKDRMAVAIPMNAVPSVQTKDTFWRMKYNQPIYTL